MKTNLLIHSRNEYTKQLVNMVGPCLYQGITHIYQTAKQATLKDSDKVLCIFEVFIKEINNWDKIIISKETQRISMSNDPEILKKLLKATLMSYVRVLTYPDLSVNMELIEDITLENFVYQCYKELGEYLKNNLFLFHDKISFYHRQKNIRETHCLIEASIKNTIRKVIPIDKVLTIYLKTGIQETEIKEPELPEIDLEPVELVLPIQPVQPVQPTQPVQQGGQLAEPIEPAEPAELAESAEPAEQEEPVELEESSDEVDRYVSSLLTKQKQSTETESISQYGKADDNQPDQAQQKDKIIEAYGEE